MRTIGVDIGSRSVKVVELESSFGGRLEVRDHQMAELNPGDDPYLLAARLIDNRPKKADRISVLLRANRSTFRNFLLPTREKKALQSAIVFELEDELPFPLEDAVYDSVTSPSYTGPGSQVHIAAPSKHWPNFCLNGARQESSRTRSSRKAGPTALLNRALGPALIERLTDQSSTTRRPQI